jgi:HK97 family phage major capsid protein
MAMRQDELKDLREQRKRVHNDMVALAETAGKENRDLTAEEDEQYERMVKDFEELENRVRRGSQLNSMKKEIEAEKTVSWMPVDQEAPNNLTEYRANLGYSKIQDEPEARQAFYHWMTAKHGEDLEIEETRVLNKTTTTAGGFLVPTDMYNDVLRALRFQGSVASLAKVITTASGDNLLYPVNSAHGVATWTAESAGYTLSDETFAQVTLSAFKAATIIKVTEELMTDSAFPLDSFLAQEFGERISVLQETGYVVGTGTGQPQGMIVAGGATSNVTTVNAAVGNAGAYTYSALVTAVFSLPQQYRANAKFLVADATARDLYLMVDGQQRPLWNVNMSDNGPDTFLGYPIYTHPDVPAPAVSVISLLFGDFNRTYAIRQVDGFSMQRLGELYAENGQVGFRGFHRVDGRVMLAASMIALKHSAT